MKQTLKDITVIIDWYNGLENDYTGINALIDARRNLSTLSFRMSVIAGTIFKEYHDAYFKRKTNFYRAKLEGIEKKKSATESETYAEVDIIPYREAESIAEGSRDSVRIVMNQVNEVLSALSQQISYLKQEKANPNND